MKRRRLRVAVASLALAMACDYFNTACTLIGCWDSLGIVFDRPAAFPFEVEMTTSGTTKHIITCASATSLECSATGVMFRDQTPTSAVVKVTTPTGTTTTTVQPVYTTTHPNGERCGPACTQGSVTVPISGT